MSRLADFFFPFVESQILALTLLWFLRSRVLRAFVGVLIRRNVRDMKADSPVHERRMLRPLGEAGSLRCVPLGCEELLLAALRLLGCLFLWVTLGQLGAHLGKQSNCRTQGAGLAKRSGPRGGLAFFFK